MLVAVRFAMVGNREFGTIWIAISILTFADLFLRAPTFLGIPTQQES